MIDRNYFYSLADDPKWYIHLKDYFEKYFFIQYNDKKSQEWREDRSKIVNIIADLLESHKLSLGENGPDFDLERKEIDTIVIHHTSTPSDTKLSYLNALTLIRLYVSEFLDQKRDYYGLPIWSGHFYEAQQTFIPYHYLVRSNGSVEHILKDEYIGWHAGNWDINCRSIAISFVDELEEKAPTNEAINSAKEIIKKYKDCKVLGHCEIRDTKCPGTLFLGENGWKKKLEIA